MANMNGMLICYGWINIPLVYTQVRDSVVAPYKSGYLILSWYDLFLPYQPRIFQSWYLCIKSLFPGGYIGRVRLFCCVSLWSTIPPSNSVQSGGKRLCPSKIPKNDLIRRQYVRENYSPFKENAFWKHWPIFNEDHPQVAKFPSVANWTGTLTPGANNIIGYDNDVRATSDECKCIKCIVDCIFQPARWEC